MAPFVSLGRSWRGGAPPRSNAGEVRDGAADFFVEEFMNTSEIPRLNMTASEPSNPKTTIRCLDLPAAHGNEQVSFQRAEFLSP